jgi:hypothetical protein
MSARETIAHCPARAAPPGRGTTAVAGGRASPIAASNRTGYFPLFW